MLKSIKKSFKYFIILIGIILLVPTFLYLLIQIPDIQTFIVKRITAHYSDQIKSTITVGRFEYVFFNRLALDEVLIKDQNKDTLIYTKRIVAGLRWLDLRKKTIRFGKIELIKPTFALITDTSGLMNINWYLNMLGTKDTVSDNQRTSIAIDHITVDEGKFKLLDLRNRESESKINFNDLNLNSINAEVTNFKIKDDSTTFTISSLQAREFNGFVIQNLSSKVTLAQHDIIFSDILINCNNSIINADLFALIPYSSNSFSRFISEVKLNLRLQRSLISSSDLSYFVPFFKGSDELIELSGRISGTVEELKGRNIVLRYRDNSYLNCDFDFSGLPAFNDAFIHLGVNTLRTNASEIERIVIPGRKKIVLPEVLHKLGNIAFDGSFTGFLSDFVTYGKIKTEKGSLKTDLSVRPVSNNRFKIKGLLAGNGIDLGELTGKSEFLGKMTMETSIDGVASSMEKIEGNITGRIDSILINKYLYRNILLNGLFTEKTWDGSITIDDRNIKMDLLGMFNFRNTLPEFDFTLNLSESNLYKLYFDKEDTTSRLSVLLTANFKGNSIDNLFGEIKLLNSSLRKHGDNLDLYNFTLKAFSEDNKPAISLRTDFLDADLRGYYNFGDLNNVLKSALASLMPSKYEIPLNGSSQIKNDFNFSFNFKNTDRINNFFRIGVLISEKSTITGDIHPDNILRLGLKSKVLTIRNNTFRDLSLDADCHNGRLNAELKSQSLSLLNQSTLKGFTVNLSTLPDNLVFNLLWDNKDEVINRGHITAIGSIAKNERQKPILHINIDSTEVYTKNNLWKIKKSDIIVDSARVNINKVLIINEDNYYLADGIISGDPTDTFRLEFKGIDLNPLNQILNPQNNSGTSFHYDFKGTLNGDIFITSALKNPLLEGNLGVKSFSLLGSNYGDLSLETSWNPRRRVADIKASNNLDGIKNLDVTGTYDPDSKVFNIDARASKLPVGALNPLLSFFASDIKGNASGKVNLRGERDNLVMTGALLAEITSFRVDYLKTRYRLNDTIRFDRSGIKFRNIRVTDEKGNYATIAGSVNHHSFKDFTADLTINMNDCLVLNTQPKDNELFYGTAYARGVTTIKSRPDLLSFEISARTGKNTRFFIPLNSGLSVSENSFVTFVTKDTAKSKEPGKVSFSTQSQTSRSALELNFDLDVTPEAEVQMLIDPKAGDVIKGRGTGKLNINLSRKGVFKISGDYIIDEGEYLFTLGNVLNKRFDVENGGKITFSGDIKNAEIDLKATYKNLKTSLYPILGDERYNERIPVEPQLNLTGKLFNPVVGLNIYLPNADEETRSLLQNSITTEEELSRQFLYLLVMNSFYQDPSMGFSSTSTASTGTSAMAVTTTEMLSNQLSNWLSQIYNDFDIGFVYRPGNKDINSQELQVALSTQLLNDKVIVNGNFDIRGANNSYGNPITGDFDVEYKITEKIRFKVFNRFNNPYTGRGAPYTQGLGLFYKHDFNRLFNANRKKEPSDMKKEDEISVK